MRISEKQAIQIEKIGIALEKSDFPMPPLAARILALLLVAEPPYCSFDEIVEVLQSSKSSISTSLNMLLKQGIVDYKTFPGNRKRYFEINTTIWLTMFRKGVEHTKRMKDILGELVETRSSEYSEFNEMLLEMKEFHVELEESLTTLLDRWEKKKS